MPKLITSVDEFKKLIPKADAIRVVEQGENVKVKLRSKKMLYTLVTNKADADTIVKESKLEVEKF